MKKQVKREKSERQAAEIKRVGEILHLQSTLDLLGGNEVREDFKTGKHGAVVSMISMYDIESVSIFVILHTSSLVAVF